MKQVVITGAAGGIGSAIAHFFAANDFFVYAVDMDGAACQKLADSIGKTHCCPVVLDVTDKQAVQAFADSLPRDFALDHLVSLAGRALEGEWSAFDRIDPQVIEASIAVNLTGHILMTHALYPFFKNHAGDKSITLISSINAKGCFGLPVYSAAKAGLSGFMHGAMKVFGNDGVRINLVSPGTVVTPATSAEPKDFEKLLATTALNRFATAHDVAKLIWQISNEFTAITGQDFVIDAGQLPNHGG